MLYDEIYNLSFAFSLKTLKFSQKFNEKNKEKLHEFITIATRIGAQINMLRNDGNFNNFIKVYKNAIVGLNKIDFILFDLLMGIVITESEFDDFKASAEYLKSKILLELNTISPDFNVDYYSLSEKFKHIVIDGKINLNKK
ncbi:MAG: hypothetical protein JXR68_13510 [Bacteroidales bacterium]|nr:hypothetical protein [Bacteroidales bacterium]